MNFAMRGRRFGVVALVGIAIFSSAEISAAADTGKPKQVTVDPVRQVIAVKGKATKAEIHLRVSSGFHINSNKPTSDLLIPTTLEFVPDAHVKVGKVEYPAGQDFKIPIAPDEKLSVYAGDVSIVAPLIVAKTTAPGIYNLKGTLTYQACSDNACYPPTKLAVEFAVKVEAAQARAK